MNTYVKNVGVAAFTYSRLTSAAVVHIECLQEIRRDIAAGGITAHHINTTTFRTRAAIARGLTAPTISTTATV